MDVHQLLDASRAFPMWIRFLALTLLVARGSAQSNHRLDDDKTMMVDIGRCRSKCVQKYVPQLPTNKKCESLKECYPCWKACFYLYTEYDVWQQMCPLYITCGKGCRYACQIRDTANPATNPMDGKFAAPPTVSTKILNNNKRKFAKIRYSIKWTAPVDSEGKEVEGTIIYYFMRRHRKARPSGEFPWQDMAQTINPQLDFNLRPRDGSEEFKVIAIGEKGKIAEIVFGADVDGYKFDKTRLANESSKIIAEQPIGLTLPPPPKFNITQQMTTNNGTIKLILLWPAVADSFIVTWGLQNCNLYKGMPKCDKTPDFYSILVWKKDKTQKQILLSLEGLMFNSEYFLDVVPDEASPYKFSQNADRVIIKTPSCEMLDETFTRCLALQDSADRKRKRRRKRKRKRKRKKHDPYTWPLHGELHFDPRVGKYIANITWDAPPNYTGKYQVFWQKWKFADDNETLASFAANIDETDYSNATIKLDANSAYFIEAKTSEQIDIGDGKLRYLFSDKLRINTTDGGHIIMAAAPSNFGSVHPVKQQKVEHHSDRNAIAIAVVSAVGIFVVVVGIVLYRRCRSELMIDKPIAANCNSYKSAFGEDKNMERMDPLLTVRDEWELDHADIKFGDVLGQGAFGKVMTGIYEDQKVAIKVLKDNAPLSYREDFIAEITLMKKLGVHPHIVTLIGACTIAEPLALVLEYMPHGNLQNFLKKCRLEGYIHQNSEGIQELQYRELTEGGEDITWNITPSDMLSFARQVALAMEYIADKQFVHRDLAARNVLVGPDKLVKLCDFGLSRDVYGTCEYHKITSGKLPLKWMALESLRDRIFTIQSDVWSFGILLWEIVTMGGSPYPSIALADLYVVLCNGYRMESPSNCSPEVYDIMHRCWEEDPADRPTFTNLRESLELLLGRELNYLQLDNIDVPIQAASNSSDVTPPGCLTVDNLELIPFADRDIVETTPLTSSLEVMTLPGADGGLVLSSSHTSGYLEANPSGYLEAKPGLVLSGLNGLSQGMFTDVV